MRIDLYLAETGMVKSRELAKRLIKEGGVSLNGKTDIKPSAEVSDSDDIKIVAELPAYVGRGGYKLEKALDVFEIDVQGLVCADIGASTGGFTDCLLKRGAEYVYAVDVGHGQLDEKLIMDSRVKNMEGTNIRSVSTEDFPREISFICADVSFISITKVIPKLSEILSDNGRAVMLIKPQFESTRADIGKNGIVRSKKAHALAMKNAAAACEAAGLAVNGADYSPVQGGDGNTEYLLYAVKGGQSMMLDFDKIAEEAQKHFK